MNNPLKNALAAFTLLSLAPAANAQYTYISTDTTINYSTTQPVIVGYATAADYGANPRTNPASPTVNFASGTIYRLAAYNSSAVSVNGGNVSASISTFDNSVVTFNSGTTGDTVEAYDNSVFNANGGTFNYILYALQNSTINVRGGSVYSVDAKSNNRITVSGGSVNNGLDAAGSSIVNISGGAIADHITLVDNSTANITGGTISPELFVADSSTLNLYGSNLAASLVNPNYSGYSEYDLSGTLQDGTLLNNQDMFIYNNGSASYHLFNTDAAVPEPGSVALFVGMMTVGAGILRRKRRK